MSDLQALAWVGGICGAVLFAYFTITAWGLRLRRDIRRDLARWDELMAAEMESRHAGCVDCGCGFTVSELDKDGLCSDCQAVRDAPPPTPEAEAARQEAIEQWSCPEPGCNVLGAHDGAHRLLIAIEDVDMIEWTKPGAYLEALRPLKTGGSR